jgi:hypothetical protein
MLVSKRQLISLLQSSPLIEVKYLNEKSSISNSSINKPNFSISFAFHFTAHNSTNGIQKVTECGENP